MGLFDDNITTAPAARLSDVSLNAATIVVHTARRYVRLDESWVEIALRIALETETHNWNDWWKGGALEDTLPIIHVKKLPHCAWRWLWGKPMFHIIIKAKISHLEPLIRVLDKDM
jgi:hypothetical protein